MSRSHRANHYGTICEKRAMDRYDLEPARASWKDAEFEHGRPVEIKSTMYRHSDGQPGTFKLYEKYHRRLRREDGHYVFVVYKATEKGVNILEMKLTHSSQVPRLSWHGGGDHRGTRQAKIQLGAIFKS
ncbi:hypothetical protein AArcSl_3074 [Halalkaliarchaeum desulfuricum]|uniref:PD(D/E)XK endonuclease domain-containing protein n=1 Tax=Halalkaliarchaeum desulfuricum TaxID=2055893 RepID=A0A343TNK9_9EURY|nr:hypothetical protein [Halalkaliarchaeum desulfuricum]AUX10681.1 hypothetical protein AArcSl_3074 [Halalkaliarchaeum desulfuricum]